MGYLARLPASLAATARATSLLGQRLEIGTKIVQWEPPKRFVSRSTGWGFEQLGEIRLDPAERGTMLTAYVEARFTSKLASLFSNWSIRAGRRRVDRDFRRLRNSIQNEERSPLRHGDRRGTHSEPSSKSLAEAEATTSRNDPRPDGAGDGH
jgi:hypothetical protein